MRSNIELSFDESDTEKIHISLKGDLDSTNIDYVLNRIKSQIGSRVPKIIVDFSGVRYVNSTGIGILLHFSISTKNGGGFFKIYAVSDNVMGIISMVGADRLLEIYNSYDDAIKSVA